VNRAYRTETNVEIVLEEVFHEVWARNLQLPLDVRNQLCQSISHPYLAAAALNLPVIGPTTFRTQFPTRRRKSIYISEEK
jgi:hypothetical protein